MSAFPNLPSPISTVWHHPGPEEDCVRLGPRCLNGSTYWTLRPRLRSQKEQGHRSLKNHTAQQQDTNPLFVSFKSSHITWVSHRLSKMSLQRPLFQVNISLINQNAHWRWGSGLSLIHWINIAPLMEGRKKATLSSARSSPPINAGSAEWKVKSGNEFYAVGSTWEMGTFPACTHLRPAVWMVEFEILTSNQLSSYSPSSNYLCWFD